MEEEKEVMVVDKMDTQESQMELEKKESDDGVDALQQDAHFMDLHSRQIGVYGLQTMAKLVKMHVFIIGLRGVGLETAKNLILAGPAKVTICDDNLVTMNDLGTNFYAKRSDVGKVKRSQAVVGELTQLNPMVDVKVHEGELNVKAIKNATVVVVTDSYNQRSVKFLNHYCHQNDIGFIMAGSMGLYGYTFLDYGDNHTITDKNGEAENHAIITHIGQENPAVVTCHSDHKHGFEDGDYVSFCEVQGMTEINTGGPYKVKVLKPTIFSVELDTTNYTMYQTGGYANEVKVPFKVKYKTLEQSLKTPYTYEKMGGKMIKQGLHNPDMWKGGRAEQLHLALTATFEFSSKHNNQLPRLNNEEDAEALYKLACDAHEKAKGMEVEDSVSVDKIEKDVFMNVARSARAQICPIASFLGGVVAQEVVKYTGKFTPLNQWLHVDWLECVPKGEVDRTPENDRYDDQVAIFGREFQKKLRDSKFFLVGCGALGCEYIKQLALMGVGCSKDGKVITTDDDCIEISNLNRQFLFRKKDVKHSKSTVAAGVGATINEDLNIKAYKIRVSPDTEKVFNDQFWEGLDGVLNALDNLKARKYVDAKCIRYSKPLFESGTLGTQCNSQNIVPFKTQSYSDSADPPEKAIPLCTLKNFPYLLDHCIQWARDFFEGQFVGASFECSQFLKKGKKYLDDLENNQTNQYELKNKLTDVKQCMESLLNKSPKECVRLARMQFESVHYEQIATLLHNFPLDHKNETGLLFWTQPKRPPQVVKYDSKNVQVLNFIWSAANIWCFVFGLKELTKEEVAVLSDSIEVPQFVPGKANIQTEGEEEKQDVGEEDEAFIKEALVFLRNVKVTEDMKVNVVDFEKDEDANHHIDWVAACSNLRARNYKIDEGTRHKIKMIAGKIIPAIATATALIVGMSGMEVIKHVLDLDVTVRRNSFVNLALPLWLFSEPAPPAVKKSKEYDDVMLGPVKVVPGEFSCWDLTHLYGPMKLADIIDHYMTEWGVTASMVGYGKYILINQWGQGMEERKQKDAKTLIEELSGETFPPWMSCMELTVSGEVDWNGVEVDALMPNLIWHFNKKE